MHWIPATLRSHDIGMVYVIRDNVQNDLLYGDRASKAIPSNLSCQFFIKPNDSDMAKCYERFFEIITKPTGSISKSRGMGIGSRVTKGEKEVAKRRTDRFFGLRIGGIHRLCRREGQKGRLHSPTHGTGTATAQCFRDSRRPASEL